MRLGKRENIIQMWMDATIAARFVIGDKCLYEGEFRLSLFCKIINHKKRIR
jgi:hypothetical protein